MGHTTLVRATIALAVVVAIGILWAAGPPTSAGAKAHAQRPTLVASVSTHYPCGDRVWLRARLKDGSPVKGTRVTLAFRLTSGTVRLHARTNAQGLARVKIRPMAETAPQGVRVRVAVKAAHKGKTLAAATWFTPKYSWGP